MEAVFVRDHCLKPHTGCKHLRNPTDIIRHLEDEFSRAEAKLTNFTELKLSEADRCSVLLQALSSEVRQYVVLHGSSSDWASLKKSLTYYEEQLRLCEIPSNNRAIKTDVLCEHCGKKGHAKNLRTAGSGRESRESKSLEKERALARRALERAMEAKTLPKERETIRKESLTRARTRAKAKTARTRRRRKEAESPVPWQEKRASQSLKPDREQSPIRLWLCGLGLGPMRSLIVH